MHEFSEPNKRFAMDYSKFVHYMLYFKWLKKQPRAIIETTRVRNLREVVSFAFNNSNFYQNLYTQAGIKKEDIPFIQLKDLPATNKKMLMDHFDDVVTDKRLKHEDILSRLNSHKKEKLKFFDKYEILKTSGTSGLLGVYPIEISDLSIIAAAVNSFLFSALDFIFHHWKRCKLMNCVVVGPHAGTVLSHYSANKLMLDKHIVSITDPMEDIVSKLNKLQPDLLTGYSSMMRSIATEQLKGNIQITPKTIICSGDGVNANTRQVIKEAFGVNPIDYYSSTENLFMGFKREKEYFSVLDPLCYIEKGSVTNLINKVFPIINYQTDDMMNFIEDYSEDPFTKIALDTQRTNNEMNVLNNYGKIIPLNICIMCSLHVEGLYAYQISRQGLDKLLVKVSGKRIGLEEKVKKAVTELLAIHEADKIVSIEVQYVEEIPPDPKTGKYKVLVA